MKPKIAIVKYFDWVIVAVLALLLLNTLYQTFLTQDTEITELRDSINRYVDTIEAGMQRTEAPPIEVPDHLAHLRNRFERLPVISAYRTNPFVVPVVVHPPLQIARGEAMTLRHEGTQIVEVVSYQQSLIRVDWEYDYEEDLTTVTVEGVAVGDSYLRLRDVTDVVHVRRVIVQEEATLPPPRPPLAALVRGYRPWEDADGRRYPGKVLVAFVPDNPDTPTADWGFTTGAQIWRKLAGAPDIDYTLLTEEPIQPITVEQAAELREEYLPFGYAGEDTFEDRFRYGGADEDVRQPTVGGEPTVPPPAEEFLRERLRAEEYRAEDEYEYEFNRDRERPSTDRRTRIREVEITLDLVLRAKSFVFEDTGVNAGESYVYRIVTTAQGPKRDLVLTDNPYETDTVEVPSLVEFAVKTVSESAAGVVVVRPKPGTEELVREEFRVETGMPIGGPVEIREPNPALEFGPGPRFIVTLVDFSTGSTFVTGVSRIRRVGYWPLRYDERNQQYVYRVRLSSDPKAMYITSTGSLRWKSKGEPTSFEREGEDGYFRRGGRRRPSNEDWRD